MTDNNASFAAADPRQSTVSFNVDTIRSPRRDELIGGGGNVCAGTPATRPRRVLLHKRNGKDGAVTVMNTLLWPMSRDKRTCNDIVHDDIKIPPAAQATLDTPYVQRLDNLRQLGCAPSCYPCSTHTRKAHSMGVMELAGQAAEHIQRNQSQLGVTAMDTLCVSIAGLCHDLGHGPSSHCYEVFLKAVRKNEQEHPEQYTERNTKFKDKFGVEMPPLQEHYEHEETSLMMIDSLLACKGLEIDWDKLDEPLKQIGDGIDATKFGVDNGQNEDGERDIEPFTSRDWVFIKECIFGKPLCTPHAPEQQEDFVGRPTGVQTGSKEFLFDIVSNRHNGLDVDKIDYYHRDSFHAYGRREGSWNILLRDMCVARALCPNRNTCFKCKKTGKAGVHLMVCYPKKHIGLAQDFFATRMKNHATVYTHKKTKGSELQMVDLLVEADKHFSMMLRTQNRSRHADPVPTRFEGFEFPQLPISRAWMYPRSFLQLDDSIVSIVENEAIKQIEDDEENGNDSSRLDRLMQLINDRKKHMFYKCAAEVEVDGNDEDWKKFWKESSEEDIKHELLNCVVKPHYQDADGGMVTLEPDDVIVEKRTLHHGRKDQNPVSQMRFLNKGDQGNLAKPVESLPFAQKVDTLPMSTPQSFLRQTIRFFSRKQGLETKLELLTHCCASWEYYKRKQLENPNSEYKLFPYGELEVEEDEEPSQQSSLGPITQDDEDMTQDDLPNTQDTGLGQSPNRKRANSDDNTKQAKKKLFSE